MSREIDWLKRLQGRALTIFLTGVLLVVTTVFSSEAIAATTEQPTIPAAQKVEQNLDNRRSALGSALENFAQETQLSLETVIQDTKNALDQLPQKLESAATDTTEIARKQLKKDLKTREKLLENAAESVDELAEKTKKFNKKVLRSAETTQVAVQAQAEQSARNTQKALEDAYEALDIIKEDVENAKDETSALFRARVDQHINAVNQALDEATQSIKALGQQPA